MVCPNPNSPLAYRDFRTGLTYADVYHMIYSRKWKRRRGVLGYWHWLKQQMYAHYLEQWKPEPSFNYGANCETAVRR